MHVHLEGYATPPTFVTFQQPEKRIVAPCLRPCPGKLRHQSLWSTTMQPTSDNPRQNGGDDFAARFRHTSEPSLRIPELVKDSEDYPVDSNVSLDTQTGSPNGDGSSAPMNRI
ncbi:hypothetical protein MRX96_058364 [Rhipicephalus microplus]